MKVFKPQSLFVVVVLMTLSACEKSAENIDNPSKKTAINTTSRVVYPLIGTDTSNSILPKKKLPRAIISIGDLFPDIKVQVIDTVCPAYLQGTKKLDISYLKENAYVAKIRNNEITITASPEFHSSGFQSLSYGPKSWWTHWNYSPYTESEHPQVLFARYPPAVNLVGVNSMDIEFDNYINTFGFEIAPNATGKDFKVVVSYKDNPSYRSQSLFDVVQTISSPSGARLIAVKSDHPFDFIEIQVLDTPDLEPGFAIANIRY